MVIVADYSRENRAFMEQTRRICFIHLSWFWAKVISNAVSV